MIPVSKTAARIRFSIADLPRPVGGLREMNVKFGHGFFLWSRERLTQFSCEVSEGSEHDKHHKTKSRYGSYCMPDKTQGIHIR